MQTMWRCWAVACLWLAAWCSLAADSLAADDVPAPSGERIVDPGARLELLFTRSAEIAGGLTEGPAVAPDGSIYFTDIPFGQDAGMILRFDPKSGKTTVFSADSGKANGLIFNADGHLIACEGAGYGGRRISQWNVETGQRETLAERFDGKRFNSPNDLCVDRRGNIYFTDPRYVGHEPRELSHRAVYRLSRDGTLTEVTHDISKPNGIAISPDERTLYVADHDNGTDNIDPAAPPPEPGDMAIYAFRLRRDGAVGRRRTLVDFEDKKGCDGMTVDQQGNLYLTVRDPSRPGVLVIEPENGSEIAFIPTGPGDQTAAEPVGLPSNVEFGRGAESHVLYITVDTSLYRIPLLAKGFHRQYGDRVADGQRRKGQKKSDADN